MSHPAAPPEVREGAALFARRSFHAAHEAFETAWRRAEGEPRMVLQALVQTAAAFHHLDRGRLPRTATLLHRAVDKLKDDPKVPWIDGAALRSSLEQALRHADAGGLPSPPDLQRLLR